LLGVTGLFVSKYLAQYFKGDAMKTIVSFIAFCLIISLMFIGCGKSDEQIKKVAALESELSQLQLQFLPKMAELNRVAWQIDSISQRNDQTAIDMATEVHTARELIMSAFNSGGGMQPTFQMELDEMPKALEANIAILKSVIEKTSNAINKSHEVVDKFNKTKAQKTSRKQ